VATSKTRQRKLARAKLERQLARRAARTRRNRQLQAGLAVGLVVITAVVVGLFLSGVFSSKSKPKPKPTAATAATAAYPRGTVAMFTKGPDSNGSQFFIASEPPTTAPSGASNS
jgi:cyclophilin family peptidyl-prolyl cis-trans isomerase